MSGKDVFVVIRDNNWGVISAGAQRASKIFNTQKEAIDYGRNIAKGRKSELVIQGGTGKFRDKDSYGNDPIDIKDRKF